MLVNSNDTMVVESLMGKALVLAVMASSGSALAIDVQAENAQLITAGVPAILEGNESTRRLQHPPLQKL